MAHDDSEWRGICSATRSGIHADYAARLGPAWHPQEHMYGHWNGDELIAPPPRPENGESICPGCHKLHRLSHRLCSNCMARERYNKGDQRYICPECGEFKHLGTQMCKACYQAKQTATAIAAGNVEPEHKHRDKPDCFDDNDWLEYGEMGRRVQRGRVYAVCADCLPEHQLEMQAAGRCTRMDVQFHKRAGGIVGV